MTRLFTPPVALGPGPILPSTTGIQRALFRHFAPLDRGVNIFKMTDGTYLIDQQPQHLSNPDPADHTDDADTAQVTYYGGHTYVVDDTEAAALTTAGLGAYLA